MSYKMHKFLVLTGLYLTICLGVSIVVGDLAQGFTLATVALTVLYVAVVKIQSR